jgi:hypothetical protein
MSWREVKKKCEMEVEDVAVLRAKFPFGAPLYLTHLQSFSDFVWAR